MRVHQPGCADLGDGHRPGEDPGPERGHAADGMRAVPRQSGEGDPAHCAGDAGGPPARHYGLDDGGGDLQGSQEVQQAGVRGGLVGSGEYGHHRCVVHAEGHSR